MMAENEENLEGNLIDFEVGSSEPNRSILRMEVALESLVDPFESLRFEHTRQSCESEDSVEIDQILISIEYEPNSSKNEITADIIDDNQENNNIHCSLDKETNSSEENQTTYDETISALNELDRILSIHDDSSETEEQTTFNEEEQASVDDCLRELDDYLQTFDVSGEEDCLCPTELIAEQRGVLKDSELRHRLSKLVARSASLGRNGKLSEKRKVSEWGTLARNHRFRATISALRRELKPNANTEQTYKRLNDQNSLDSSNNQLIKHKNLSSSTKDIRQKISNLVRNSNLRATVCALHSTNFLPCTTKINLESNEQTFSESQVSDHVLSTAGGSPGRDRKSGEGAHVDLVSDEEIDWGWVQEVNSCESHLTGNDPEVPINKITAVGYAVETQVRVRTEEESNVLPDLIPVEEQRCNMDLHSDDINIQKDVSNELQRSNSFIGRHDGSLPIDILAKEDSQQSSSWMRDSLRRITPELINSQPKTPDLQRPSSSSWLRSSMRRIRHFRLPSDPSPNEPIVTSLIPDVEVMAPAVPQQRPFSAPVRISSEVTVNVVQTDVRDNSISAESVARVHARSSSESSRSRRARSLSSSESSLDSSVDSTPSCLPGALPNGAIGIDIPPTGARR